MSMPLTIRPALSGDFGAMIALFRRSVREVAGRDYTPAQVAAWAPDEIEPTDWAARFNGRSAWVAEAGGTILGFVSLGPEGHVHMLFVHPDHQRQGVAGRLLDHVEGVARRAGLTRLTTESSITARPFFESRGFGVVECEVVTRGGQDFIRYRMGCPMHPLPDAAPNASVNEFCITSMLG